MTPYDTAAFTDRLLHEKSVVRLQIMAIDAVKARLKIRCLNYAIEIERQLDMQRGNQGFVEGLQNEVNNFSRRDRTTSIGSCRKRHSSARRARRRIFHCCSRRCAAR
jgi:hypothetical protein